MLQPKSVLKYCLKIVFAAIFIAGGLNHFAHTPFYAHMVPPWLPRHVMLVQATGIAELVLGMLLLNRWTSRCAAWGLIALLILVFPANIHMALHPELFPEYRPVMLWLRLPLQGVLIAWAWAYTRRSTPPPS